MRSSTAPPSYPIIGTTDPVVALAGLLAVAWTTLALATLFRVVVADRTDLRVLATQVAASVIVAGLAAVWLRLDGDRWRSVADGAAAAAAGCLYVLLPVLLAWAATRGQPRRR